MSFFCLVESRRKIREWDIHATCSRWYLAWLRTCLLLASLFLAKFIFFILLSFFLSCLLAFFLSFFLSTVETICFVISWHSARLDGICNHGGSDLFIFMFYVFFLPGGVMKSTLVAVGNCSFELIKGRGGGRDSLFFSCFSWKKEMKERREWHGKRNQGLKIFLFSSLPSLSCPHFLSAEVRCSVFRHTCAGRLTRSYVSEVPKWR